MSVTFLLLVFFNLDTQYAALSNNFFLNNILNDILFPPLHQKNESERMPSDSQINMLLAHGFLFAWGISLSYSSIYDILLSLTSCMWMFIHILFNNIDCT